MFEAGESRFAAVRDRIGLTRFASSHHSAWCKLADLHLLGEDKTYDKLMLSAYQVQAHRKKMNPKSCHGVAAKIVSCPHLLGL